MPGSTVAKLAAGTEFQHDAVLTGTFVKVPGVTAIGTVGEAGEFIETTPLDATTREYIAGLRTPEDKNIVLNDIPGNTEQADFLTRAKAGETLNIKIVFPNGRTGAFSLVLNGYKVNEPNNANQITITVFGKQSGETTWTIA